MKCTLGAGVVLLLASLLYTAPAQAQDVGGDRVKSRIEQGQAGPYNATIVIPFTLIEADFDEGEPVVVTIRILNLLGQVVAVPTAVGHPGGVVAVEDLKYATPGHKEAYWHGLDRTGHRVAAGVYLLELVVNGERAPPQRIVVGA
jgi:hypothetical protein